MDDLFSLPMGLDPSKAPRTRRATALVPDSYVIERTNERGKPYSQVRLSDDEHAQAVRAVRSLHGLLEDATSGHMQRDIAHIVKSIFDLESPLWGSRVHRRVTMGEAIEGMREKTQRSIRELPGRMGEDYSIKQLNVLNDLIDRFNALTQTEGEPPAFQRIAIPFKK